MLPSGQVSVELRAFVFFAAQRAAFGDQRGSGLCGRGAARGLGRDDHRRLRLRRDGGRGLVAFADQGRDRVEALLLLVDPQQCRDRARHGDFALDRVALLFGVGRILAGDDDLVALRIESISASAETVSVSTTRRRSSSSLFVPLMALSGRPGSEGSLNFSVKVTPSLASSARVIFAGAFGAPPRSMRR